MLGPLDVDLLFTGEMSHHEALSATERGQVVITAFHSNTERAFLKQRMQQQLVVGIQEEIDNVNAGAGDVSKLVRADFEVSVSKVDRDPFEIVLIGPQLSGW